MATPYEEEWYRTYIQGGDITSHLRSINREGLSSEEATSLESFVISLGREMGSAWTPGGCTIIQNLTEFANRKHPRSSFANYFGLLVPKRYIRSHFFWIANAHEGNKILILDPTGVPKDKAYFQTGDTSSIVPYFGLADKATGFHREVYDKMQDMDDWGTRDL